MNANVNVCVAVCMQTKRRTFTRRNIFLHSFNLESNVKAFKSNTIFCVFCLCSVFLANQIKLFFSLLDVRHTDTRTS